MGDAKGSSDAEGDASVRKNDELVGAAAGDEARLRMLTDQIPAVVWSTDVDLRFTSIAGAALKGLGLRAEELIGLCLLDYVGKRDPNDPLAVPSLAALRGESSAFELEWRTRSFEAHVEPLRGATGDVVGTLGIALDVSERKQAERDRNLLQSRLRHQQKLESIGTLARGVAHEINNPVQSIMNYAQLIKRRGVSQEVDGYAAEILHEAQRVASIVRNLLAFARQAGEPYAEVRVRDVVDATLSLTSAMFHKEGIRVSLELTDDVRWVRCHPQQIQQVLMNVLANARDALLERYPEHQASQAEKVIFIKAHVLRREADTTWARLTVEDHGTGIPLELRDKVFDPFCTTKTDRPGAGLGLSIAHGIVAEHGGVISVESEAGHWTRCHIDLPAR